MGIEDFVEMHTIEYCYIDRTEKKVQGTIGLKPSKSYHPRQKGTDPRFPPCAPYRGNAPL